MLKKHRIFRSKPNHCISSGQNVQPFLKSIPERNAVARSSLVALLLPKLQKCKKSTVCPRTNIMKYRLRGVYRALPSLRNAIMRRMLVTPFFMTLHQRRQAWHTPEQTYRRISLWRSVPRLFISLTTKASPTS